MLYVSAELASPNALVRRRPIVRISSKMSLISLSLFMPASQLVDFERMPLSRLRCCFSIRFRKPLPTTSTLPNVFVQRTSGSSSRLARHAKRTLQATRGLSTGPKTAEGIERIRRAKTKHGLSSAAAIAERQQFRALFKDCQEVLFAAKRVFWEKNNTRVGPNN
jgi:hypothetical protein